MAKEGREAELWEDIAPEMMSEEEDGEVYIDTNQHIDGIH